MIGHMTKTVLSSEADELTFLCTEGDMLSHVKVRDLVNCGAPTVIVKIFSELYGSESLLLDITEMNE